MLLGPENILSTAMSTVLDFAPDPVACPGQSIKGHIS